MNHFKRNTLLVSLILEVTNLTLRKSAKTVKNQSITRIMTFLIRLRIQHLRKNNKTGEEVDIAETIIEEEEMANIEEDEVETMKDVEAIEV